MSRIEHIGSFEIYKVDIPVQVDSESGKPIKSSEIIQTRLPELPMKLAQLPAEYDKSHGQWRSFNKKFSKISAKFAQLYVQHKEITNTVNSVYLKIPTIVQNCEEVRAYYRTFTTSAAPILPNRMGCVLLDEKNAEQELEDTRIVKIFIGSGRNKANEPGEAVHQIRLADKTEIKKSFDQERLLKTFNGLAKKEYPDGSSYSGNWQEGEWNGLGIFSKDGEVYSGEFENGKKEGLGVFTNKDGATFTGQWKDGELHGLAEITFMEGTKYQGITKANKSHGYGEYQEASGDIYRGYWIAGSRSGLGEMQYANGDSYNGEWKDNRYEGPGEKKYANGDIYKGNFSNGSFHGRGTFWSAHKFKYEGEWKYGIFHGYGKKTCHYKNKTYEGDWENGIRHGYGILNDRDKEYIYHGLWVNGKKIGPGLRREYNGDIYEGDWAYNHPHGKGVFYRLGEEKMSADEKTGMPVNTALMLIYYLGEVVGGIPHGKGIGNFKNQAPPDERIRCEDNEWDKYKGTFYDTLSHTNKVGRTPVRDLEKESASKMRYEELFGGLPLNATWKCEREFTSRDIYEGDWREGEPSGFGKMRYGDGNTYEGEWLRGKEHGQGCMKYFDGEEYSGDWVEGKRAGKGTLKYLNGNEYVGQWKDDLQEDENAQLKMSCGDWEVWSWKAGEQLQIKEIYTQRDGSHYIGGFLDGRPHGIGTVTLASGVVIEGNWKNGELGGDVKATFQEGIYCGEWPEGRGTFTYNDNSIIEGEFLNGMPQGRVEKTLDSGEKISGIWRDGEFLVPQVYDYGTYYPHSADSGEFQYNGGSVYVGPIKEGFPSGEGTLTFSNEAYFYGTWVKCLGSPESILTVENSSDPDVKKEDMWKLGLGDTKGMLSFKPFNYGALKKEGSAQSLRRASVDNGPPPSPKGKNSPLLNLPTSPSSPRNLQPVSKASNGPPPLNRSKTSGHLPTSTSGSFLASLASSAGAAAEALLSPRFSGESRPRAHSSSSEGAVPVNGELELPKNIPNKKPGPEGAIN